MNHYAPLTTMQQVSRIVVAKAGLCRLPEKRDVKVPYPNPPLILLIVSGLSYSLEKKLMDSLP